MGKMYRRGKGQTNRSINIYIFFARFLDLSKRSLRLKMVSMATFHPRLCEQGSSKNYGFPMFMIVYNLRLFLTTVTPTAVTPTAVLLENIG